MDNKEQLIRSLASHTLLEEYTDEDSIDLESSRLTLHLPINFEEEIVNTFERTCLTGHEWETTTINIPELTITINFKKKNKESVLVEFELLNPSSLLLTTPKDINDENNYYSWIMHLVGKDVIGDKARSNIIKLITYTCNDVTEDYNNIGYNIFNDIMKLKNRWNELAECVETYNDKIEAVDKYLDDIDTTLNII